MRHAGRPRKPVAASQPKSAGAAKGVGGRARIRGAGLGGGAEGWNWRGELLKGAPLWKPGR